MQERTPTEAITGTSVIIPGSYETPRPVPIHNWTASVQNKRFVFGP
jgi:hypothetical protein